METTKGLEREGRESPTRDWSVIESRPVATCETLVSSVTVVSYIVTYGLRGRTLRVPDSEKPLSQGVTTETRTVPAGVHPAMSTVHTVWFRPSLLTNSKVFFLSSSVIPFWS